MTTVADPADSRGDIMKRLTELTDRVKRLETARRLEAASIGRGGLRIQGGRLLAEDASGGRVFEVTTEPAGIFLRPELITDLSVAIFADRVNSADVTATEGTTAITFEDLATVGPTVANVEVSDSGKALVFVSAGMASSFTGRGCRMSFVISGATTEGATLARSVAAIFTSTPFDVGIGRSFAIDGLNPGLHTFQAKYRSHSGTEVFFYDRSLVVIGL